MSDSERKAEQGAGTASSGAVARGPHRMPPGHPTPVRVLLRGLELIQVLNRQGPLTTAALSQKLRLARTTVNRCLATLEAQGFVERESDSRRFKLTIKARTLSHGFDPVTERLEPVRAQLHAAATRVQWPMTVMRFRFPEMFIEDSTDRESGFAVEYFERGMTIPVLTSASGRAFLAYSSAKVRESVLDHLWPVRPDETQAIWPDRAALVCCPPCSKSRTPRIFDARGLHAPPLMHTAERRALAQMHFCVLLWGFTAILGKLISLPAAALVVWRMVLVTGMLAAIPAVWRGLRAMSVRGIAIYAGIGVVLALHWLTFYGAIKLANASVAVSCVALGSIFTAILEPWLTRRAHERHEFLLGLIAVPGVVLVAGGIPAGMQLGLAVGILSAFLTALLSTLNKRHIGDGSALALTFVQIGAGAIFVALGMYLLQGSESLTTLPAGEDLLWLLL
ncbi:MAG: MarR family transcriptional regulator, partial [Gammaproteobacteria bacterium]|nr:MarR family transcriptional regulator [Gammaproteobacteria bacterium]